MKFLLLSIIAIPFFLISCTEKISQSGRTSDVIKTNQSADSPFQHGVASGDPLTDRVIIWTRVSPTKEKVLVAKWEISESGDFRNILQSGLQSTDATRDFTIKIDVGSLSPRTRYYYRFKTIGKTSPVGQTKTLPAGSTSDIRLGVVSCSNYEFGYFNAYNGLSDQNLDAILHLGDYIYEYGPNKYGDTSFTRKHLPAKEIITLQDYRIRYAQYREDKGLQRAHQNHPFILTWDDHEIANNAYKTGAQNHQPDEGDYDARKANAKKAYYEWQPIRETKNNELYRKFSFGNLVDVFMLDERITGRQAPPDTKEQASFPRSMLGAKQLDWLKKEMKNSKAIWKIIGNQVIFSPTDLSIVRPKSPVNLDAWDGYTTERDDIRSFLSTTPIINTIFVTGDTHASWAFEVPANDESYKDTGISCAVEFGTPSITSSNWNESSPDEQVIMAEQALRSTNSHLKYVNGRDHGFVIVSLSADKAVAEWYYTSDIKTEKAPIHLAKSFVVTSKKMKLKEM